MKLRDGHVLKDDPCIGEVLGETLHCGLGFLAVRTLKVSELHEHKVFGGGAASSAVSAVLDSLARFGERSHSKVDDAFSACDSVLAVGRNEEDRVQHLGVWSLIRDIDDHPAHA